MRRTSSRASNESVDERAGDSSDGSPPASSPLRSSEGSRAGVQILAPHNALGRRHLGADDFPGCQVRFRLPSNAQLCRIFFAMTAMITLFNVASWGMGTCTGRTCPRTGRFAPSHDLQRLYERSTIYEVNNGVNPREPRSASTSVGRRFSGWN